jgi:glycosyltransferase involved in cell wall biosynthesis
MTKKRKILYICQYFYPETFRGNDIAFHLASEGHEVHVVTGIPNYPKGKFYDGYGLFSRRSEVINGVKVTRLPIIPRGESKVTLMLNYFSYFIVSWIYILFHAITNKYDLVFCQQLSPIMMSSAAVLYKRLRKIPLYTWVLDLWPESLTAAAGINNKLILSFFDRFVKSEYKWSDKILTSSKSFSSSILKYGDYAHKIIYYPQWGDAEPLEAKNETSEVLPEIPDGFIVMFAGAVGEAHGFECNLQAALLTKANHNIKWVIVGDGRKLEWVRQFVTEHKLNDTVITLGRYPANTMPSFFAKADVMLVSLSDSPLFNLYAPAKISSYMAASKPIVTCLNGEGRDVIYSADCGWSVDANDSKGLAELVIKLSKLDSNILVAKGANGRKYYDEHFEKNKCLINLDNILGLN